MAPQVTTEGLRAAPAGRRTGSLPPPRDDPHRLLQRTARLAAELVRVPAARVYLRSSGGPELKASFPAPSGGRREDPHALTTAREVLRVRAVVVGSTRAESQSLATRERATNLGTSHLGVPLCGAEGNVLGALVVSDAGGREWSDAEIDRLGDLAAVGVAGLRGERHGPGAAASPNTQPSRPPAGAAERSQPPSVTAPRDAGAPGLAELFSEAGDAALVEIIRQSIVGSLHLGALHAGDRLPSIRQTARAFSVTPYMVLQAYAELEMEGLVERRERSGVFVASFEVSASASLPETGAWLTEVLTQACQHQVKIPLLPDLIRRWTTAVRVRCACVESCLDSRFALALELSQQFGIEPTSTSASVTARDLEDADLVITTAYHAAEVGPLVAEIQKPMLIATVSPIILSSALNHLRERDLTVICVDPSYGERLRALQGGAYRDRVRVVTADDAPALATLDRSEAVLLTPAARQRLEQPDFRLVAPMYPSYSIDFARKVAEAVVRINLQGARA